MRAFLFYLKKIFLIMIEKNQSEKISAIRKWIKIIHRDLGYICFGLCVVYAVSGFAVNHMNDWNPNYIKEIREIKIKNFDYMSIEEDKELARRVLKEAELNYQIDDCFFENRYLFKIFLKDGIIEVDFKNFQVKIEKTKKRPIFYELNYLHLNKAKKAWTYIADAFAVSLFVLALTGLFMIKGKNGITGRGAYLTAIGLLLPIVFIVVYIYL